MFWRIFPHLTACIAAELIVLLDIRQDRYFLVPSALAPSVSKWLRSSAQTAPPQAFADLLVASGILRESDSYAVTAASHEVVIPVTLEATSPPPRISRVSRLGVAVSMMSTRLAVRRLPLATVLGGYGNRPVAAARGKPDAIALAQQFKSACLPLPFARQCLQDSLALAGWLKRRGVQPTVVFGVAVPAFAAHCWVQHDDAILNDSFDRVSRFTPILAL